MPDGKVHRGFSGEIPHTHTHTQTLCIVVSYLSVTLLSNCQHSPTDGEIKLLCLKPRVGSGDGSVSKVLVA